MKYKNNSKGLESICKSCGIIFCSIEKNIENTVFREEFCTRCLGKYVKGVYKLKTREYSHQYAKTGLSKAVDFIGSDD
jgi:hypothetical protein